MALSTSGRTEPEACASRTSDAIWWSNALRRAQRRPFHVAVATHAQQQSHVGQPVEEHFHRGAKHEVQALGCRSGLRAGLREDALQTVERLAERHLEQLLLRCEVVVHRGLGQAESRREIRYGCRVVPLLVEQRDRRREHFVAVITRAPAAAGGSGFEGGHALSLAPDRGAIRLRFAIFGWF